MFAGNAKDQEQVALLKGPISSIIRVAELSKQLIGAALLLTFIIVAGLLFCSFSQDIITIMHRKIPTNMGLLHAFGTLLVLWTVTELIHAEIEVLRGHRFGVAVLVDVAMAAAVRKILLSDFNVDRVFFGSVGALVILALVRWLISWSEDREAKVIERQANATKVAKV